MVSPDGLMNFEGLIRFPLGGSSFQGLKEAIMEVNYAGMGARVFPMTSRFTTDLGNFPIRTFATFSAVLRFNSLIDSTE